MRLAPLCLLDIPPLLSSSLYTIKFIAFYIAKVGTGLYTFGIGCFWMRAVMQFQRQA